jgi:hypothetical protein
MAAPTTSLLDQGGDEDYYSGSGSDGSIWNQHHVVAIVADANFSHGGIWHNGVWSDIYGYWSGGQRYQLRNISPRHNANQCGYRPDASRNPEHYIGNSWRPHDWKYRRRRYGWNCA